MHTFSTNKCTVFVHKRSVLLSKAKRKEKKNGKCGMCG